MTKDQAANENRDGVNNMTSLAGMSSSTGEASGEQKSESTISEDGLTFKDNPTPEPNYRPRNFLFRTISHAGSQQDMNEEDAAGKPLTPNVSFT